eukprot:TRINITY_DN4413_c0_g1_i1.p1 TRINITY_DN4413_c0_g1~~TRINITY_DN4413_c0_g1_i1.p1  ORF type:complete len:932 (+),score=366.66 TRINITY_DN4413_c0_g1_i1:88-2796(+)
MEIEQSAPADNGNGQEMKVLNKDAADPISNEEKNFTDPRPNGLSQTQVDELLKQYGPNSLPEKRKYAIIEFLRYFWSPLAWAMEVAAIVSIILVDYVDFILIFALLFFNACIGFYEERSAGNALDALKNQLAPAAMCVRDGNAEKIDAKTLVPGDLLMLKLGDIVPADALVLQGECKADEAALTGESLPVTKYEGDKLLSGSTIKEGELDAVVCDTGVNTFFGRAAKIVSETNEEGHLQKVLDYIGIFCISYILIWVILELIIEFAVYDRPCDGVMDCPTLLNCLVIVIGGIPIAMPTVLSVTMALGASELAKHKAIVSRLTAIEELAGVDILCSDKTGTLTLNQLTLDTPLCYGNATNDDIMFYSLLGSRTENMDAIDTAVVHATENMREKYDSYKHLVFKPFEPVGKKTMASCQAPDGKMIHVSKGAPQQILNLVFNSKHDDAFGSKREGLREEVEKNIDDYAGRGYRVIGVGHSDSQELDGSEEWFFDGLLPLYDPPRHDTAETVARVKEMDVGVKMVTGDHLAIAKETGRNLGIGDMMFSSKKLAAASGGAGGISGMSLKQIEDADGFAEVYPEHKYEIVARLQKGGHIVAMTGDGVNDAPALKKADVGIAVAGSTDAARAAADIILTSPGLSVIVTAIIRARKIFQRMKNYTTYSVTTCVRIATTFGLLTLIWDFQFPTLLIVILAILNDGTMITISKDRVKPSKSPESWNLPLLFISGLIYGLYLSLSTLILFYIAHSTTLFKNLELAQLTENELRGMVYLHVSASGSLIIFVTRSQYFSWMERPGFLLFCSLILSQAAATCIAIWGFNGYPNDGATDFEGCGWGYALLVWVWVLIWYVPLDPMKMVIQYVARRVDKILQKRKLAMAEEEDRNNNAKLRKSLSEKTFKQQLGESKV